MERSLKKLLIMIVRLWTYMIHYWELVRREGSDDAEKGAFFPITFLQVPYHGMYLQNPKDFALLGRLRIIMDCNGKPE